MKCIHCGANTAVVDKRTSTDNLTRRRRKCLKCGKRFTTNEILVADKVQKEKTEIEMKKPIIKIKKVKVVKVKKHKAKILPKQETPLSPEKANLIALFKKGVKHD